MGEGTVDSCKTDPVGLPSHYISVSATHPYTKASLERVHAPASDLYALFRASVHSV